ncbi:MAG: multicopper oxidase domain-containing protein [Actinobacteria bacterium]|nr:multicopper oxidase domain-containing protein [Actinomycetota bacterium]
MTVPAPAQPRRQGNALTSFLALGAFLVAAIAVLAVTIGDRPGRVSTEDTTPVAVTLTEFAIAPKLITVPEGGSLAVTNAGSTMHTFSIPSASRGTGEIEGGASAALDLSGLKPGNYEVQCDVAGHKEAGMTGSLVVTAAGSGSGEVAAAGSQAGAGASASSGTGDPNAITPAQAAKMDQDMAKGVRTFLDQAKQYAAGKVKRGVQPLAPKILADGTKRFELTAAITDWEVSKDKIVKAWTYNGVVPGPTIKVDPGDKVAIVIRNLLPISTDVHFHGIDVPNDQDGVAPLTQQPIKSGRTYTYRFTAPPTPELGMYHAHDRGQVAVVNGLFAPFEVGSVALPRGRTVAGVPVPPDLELAQEYQMVLNDAGVIGLSLNGKSFPYTEPVTVKQGDWILVNYFNEGLLGHPMHLHRQVQIVVAKDGFPLDSPYRADTIWVAPGERYSVLVRADAKGTWAWHCHILNHAESAQGLFGMVTAMVVK